MDGRVYAAGDLRIACTRGCAAGGSTGDYCITQMRFWSSGQCVHASPCSSQSLGILSTNVTRGVSERRGRACVSESVWEESITVFALTYFWKIVRVSSP